MISLVHPLCIAVWVVCPPYSFAVPASPSREQAIPAKPMQQHQGLVACVCVYPERMRTTHEHWTERFKQTSSSELLHSCCPCPYCSLCLCHTTMREMTSKITGLLNGWGVAPIRTACTFPPVAMGMQWIYPALLEKPTHCLSHKNMADRTCVHPHTLPGLYSHCSVNSLYFLIAASSYSACP